MAHACGVSVEGELGVLGCLETGMGEKEDGHGFEGKLAHDQLLTDPDEAVRFVADTRVDALAVAMGTSHGAYKFTRKPDGDVLAMNVIEEIHRRLPNTHLVMHGSSSVPQDLQDADQRATAARSSRPGACRSRRSSAASSTACARSTSTPTTGMAITGAIRKVLVENRGEFDPRKYLKPAMEAMKKLCVDRFEAFGTAGQADRIKPIPLAEMARRYASGSLGPAT